MTLPFNQDPDRGKRKWQCFVCGVEYKTYEEFKDHIVHSHEEGREYVACQKCEAPVRDLKMHYKIKHPGWSVPAGVQHKATVWCDFKPGGAKKKRTATKFREGTFISQKMGGKELHYRSGYECEVYELLEQLPDVLHYAAEPIEIPYFYADPKNPNQNGEWRKYRPDLAIQFADGRKEIWEVKPATQTTLAINEAKWTFAQKYCDERGWGFMVLTEVGMGKMRKKVQNNRNINWDVKSPEQSQEWMDSPEGLETL